jgi:pimeloyl-ACP methyl ester carboxylesterase
VRGSLAIDEWWASGERVALPCGGAERQIFIRRLGRGPTLTLLHGFPSCSYDWSRVVAPLSAEHELLLLDLLGFGASEKPADHAFSLHGQADLVEALWRATGTTSTALLVHDYSVSIAQELLAREAEGALEVELRGVTMLNGGLYPELHRPEPAQLALLDPEQGPVLSRAMSGEVLRGVLAPTFAEPSRHDQDCDDIWRSITRGVDSPILHRLIQYMPDRVEHRDRWVGALEGTKVPLVFVWGMLDPISGAHIAERIAERLPHARLTRLDDVGHWPSLEAPDRVVAGVSV